MTLRPEDVRDILAILDSSPYDALTLRTDRFEVSLRRGPAGWTSELLPLAEPRFLEATAAGASPEPSAPEAASSAAGGAPVPGVGGPPVEDLDVRRHHPGADDGGMPALVAVTAPVVGTFYRAPRPGAPPFVEVGDRVEPDTVVGVLETMKLMTSVPAGAAGTVREICVGNDEFAEQGATLLRIQPALEDRAPGAVTR